MTIAPADIVPNDYLTDLGTDHVAIAANGHPIGRASTREAIERACPGAAAYVTAADMINDGLAPKRGFAPLPADGVALTSIVHPAITAIPVADGVALTSMRHPAATTAPAEPVISEDSLVYGTVTTDDETGAITSVTFDGDTPPPVVDGSAFDHDHDGRPGGSKPLTERKRKPKS